MSLVSKTPGLFSANLIIIIYLFFEMILVFWHIVLEPCLLLSPDDQMYITIKHDWALTATRSFLLLTVAYHFMRRIIYLHLSYRIGLGCPYCCRSSISSTGSVLGVGNSLQ